MKSHLNVCTRVGAYVYRMCDTCAIQVCMCSNRKSAGLRTAYICMNACICLCMCKMYICMYLCIYASYLTFLWPTHWVGQLRVCTHVKLHAHSIYTYIPMYICAYIFIHQHAEILVKSFTRVEIAIITTLSACLFEHARA
jgi:hypothetical protein